MPYPCYRSYDGLEFILTYVAVHHDPQFMTFRFRIRHILVSRCIVNYINCWNVLSGHPYKYFVPHSRRSVHQRTLYCNVPLFGTHPLSPCEVQHMWLCFRKCHILLQTYFQTFKDHGHARYRQPYITAQANCPRPVQANHTRPLRHRNHVQYSNTTVSFPAIHCRPRSSSLQTITLLLLTMQPL